MKKYGKYILYLLLFVSASQLVNAQVSEKAIANFTIKEHLEEMEEFVDIMEPVLLLGEQDVIMYFEEVEEEEDEDEREEEEEDDELKLFLRNSITSLKKEASFLKDLTKRLGADELEKLSSIAINIKKGMLYEYLETQLQPDRVVTIFYNGTEFEVEVFQLKFSEN